MQFKNVSNKDIVSSLEAYIAWNKERESNPFFKVRAIKGKEILAIINNEPNNQGYHDDMVEAIYNLYKECERGVISTVNNTSILPFEKTFYYIYSILVPQNKMEQIMNEYNPSIIEIYKTEPENAMKIILTEISILADNSIHEIRINNLKKILEYLMRFI